MEATPTSALLDTVLTLVNVLAIFYVFCLLVWKIADWAEETLKKRHRKD